MLHSHKFSHSHTDATCLVTAGEGRFYSSGLDINTESPLNHDAHQIAHDMGMLQTLLARLLTFPMPTVSAITGATDAIYNNFYVMCFIIV